MDKAPLSVTKRLLSFFSNHLQHKVGLVQSVDQQPWAVSEAGEVFATWAKNILAWSQIILILIPNWFLYKAIFMVWHKQRQCCNADRQQHLHQLWNGTLHSLLGCTCWRGAKPQGCQHWSPWLCFIAMGLAWDFISMKVRWSKYSAFGAL